MRRNQQDGLALWVERKRHSPLSIRYPEPDLFHVRVTRSLQRVNPRTSQFRAEPLQKPRRRENLDPHTLFKSVKLLFELVPDLDDPGHTTIMALKSYAIGFISRLSAAVDTSPMATKTPPCRAGSIFPANLSVLGPLLLQDWTEYGVMKTLLLSLLLACLLSAQDAGPDNQAAHQVLDQAYAALRAQDYEAAVEAFQQAIRLAPDRPGVRKDLAYALLKIGENEAARDQFAGAMKLDPADFHVALEYAFLCHETGQQTIARRVFDRVRREGDDASRQTAEQAFRNIDRPLAEGIARWRDVVAAAPENFSAHHELARLADARDERELAARHFHAAWRLRPDQRSLLLDLGRLWKELGREEEARAALLAASRGAEPRAAESAMALLPDRYPYVNEFRQALELDPANTRLRRELAYLLLEMGRREEAEAEFEVIVEAAPEDHLSAAQLGFLRLNRRDYDGAMPLLERVLESGDAELQDRVRAALSLPQQLARGPETPRAEVAVEAKEFATKSLEKGYLKDAMKYLAIAHDTDPADFAVMLSLGKTHNIMKQDEAAVRWFDLARRSPDPAVAAEAEQAYRNLKPSFARFRTTFWIMPFYSKRWSDVFAYSQWRTEVRLRNLPVRPYVSLRFSGDARQTAGSVTPQYLSESSFVAGVGLRTETWQGATLWVEAGSDLSYLNRQDRPGRMAPDYRGGVAFFRGFGNMLGGEAPGLFAQTSDDGVFLSRFDNTFLGQSQNRFGYTLPEWEQAGGLQAQLCWNGNLTLDTKRQAWANFVETGPGIRFRWKGLPKSVVFTVDFMKGAYLLDNPARGTDFTDVRAGVWYAISR